MLVLTQDSLLPAPPGAHVVDPTNATLLGSSVGNDSSISVILSAKPDMLKRMGVRLQHLSAQDAFLLLRHSFAIPKLLYNLRTSPCFLSPVLLEYDKLLKSIVGRITNICFDVDNRVWDQATLPVKMGALGIRSAMQLAPSAFLASAAASYDLVLHIIPPHLHGSLCPTWRMLKPCGPKVMIVILLKGSSVQVEGLGHQENIFPG